MSLPKGLKQRLDDAFKGERKFGPKAGPGKAGLRLLMQHILDAGLSPFDAEQILNPAGYRGMNDPDGGGLLIADVTDVPTLRAIVKFCKQAKGSGIVEGGSTDAQAAFFDAVPGMREKYVALAEG